MVSVVEVKKHASRRDATTVGDLHAHPLLDDVFELLHRMTKSQDQVLGWYAWDAIKKLHQYEEQITKQQVPGAN